MTVRVLVAALIALLAVASGAAWRSSFQQPAAASPQGAHSPVAIDLRSIDGSAALHAFALPGTAFTIDPSKLHFLARPYGNSRAIAKPLAATIGAPVLVPSKASPPAAGLIDYEMPVEFHPAQSPGMYHVNLDADPGFAKTPDGQSLEYGNWSVEDAKLAFYLWIPDVSNGDSTLARAHARLAGKDVYGFGGIDIGCPHWHNMYTASAAIRVKDVVREHDTVDELWTGSTVHWGNDMALHFFAIDPLRIVVETPSAKPAALGGSNQATTDVRPCPAITLADFQTDAVVSVVPPPESQTAQELFYTGKVKLGMTRPEVAWLRGYPNEFGDREKLDGESTWQYFDGPRDGFAVTFANDRVAGFPTPDLPAYP